MCKASLLFILCGITATTVFLLNKRSVSHPKLIQIYINSSNHSTRRKQRITDFKTAL